MEIINLHQKKLYDGCENVTMECYIQKSSPELRMPPRPAIIIFPGGGYEYTSDREASPVASVFLAAGFSAFVVRYSCKEKAIDKNPLLDAAMAVYTVRSNAEKYFIDPDKISVCGFSAGGHLASFISTQWHIDLIREKLEIENELAKPNAMILGYPVISGFRSPHSPSFKNLTGGDGLTDKNLNEFSVDLLVDERTCPAFVWHTANDTVVDVKNSLNLCEALSNYNILFELHVMPKGYHGLSTATYEVASGGDINNINSYCARWTDWAVKWLNNLFYNPDFKTIL